MRLGQSSEEKDYPAEIVSTKAVWIYGTAQVQL